MIEGFGKEGGGESLASSVGAFRAIVSQIQDGRGLLHSLIYDEYTGGGVGSIERSLARFENILREIDEGEMVWRPMASRRINTLKLGVLVPKGRALPFAALCRECQEAQERRLLEQRALRQAEARLSELSGGR